MSSWREELLGVLKESGEQYVKGEELAERFGFSRAAVWKRISILRSEGYPIEATTNRGYRITARDREFEQKVMDALEAEKITGIFDIHVTDTTPSTNLLAREAGARGEKEVGVFAALKQTAGRGRRGRVWISDTDEGLWFSFLLRPQVDPRSASSLTLLFGLCIMDALQLICNVPVGIKWPNDIISLQNGKKICGILSETSMEDNLISYAVVGCGINVSQKSFPAEIEAVATSLLMEGVKIDKTVLLTAILREVASRYPAYIKDPAGFIPEYRTQCATLGRIVRIESGTRDEGTAIDITSAGDLLVRWTDGTTITCTSGEVSVRGMLGYI
jgi:BirA family transcriptional regulator, biotin operon repressor / biotin---[acetyl-CoA-carboxylase] ligase